MNRPTTGRGRQRALELPSTGAECAEGAQAAWLNAKELLAAARLLDDSGHAGPAVSLYASTAEEASKALALYFAGVIGPGPLSPSVLRVLRKVMAHHPAKHAVASLASASQSLWFWAAMGLAYMVDREGLATSFSNAITSTPEMLTIGWFAEADELRQKGLYVDRADGRWRTPRMLGPADCLTAREAVQRLIELASRAFAPAGPQA